MLPRGITGFYRPFPVKWLANTITTSPASAAAAPVKESVYDSRHHLHPCHSRRIYQQRSGTMKGIRYVTSIRPFSQDARSSLGEEEEDLPPLSPTEFKIYNRLAVRMNRFVSTQSLGKEIILSKISLTISLTDQHDGFRSTFRRIHEIANGNEIPATMSTQQFISMGLGFHQNLTKHHRIEETSFFPRLAKKIPDFFENGHGSVLVGQHEKIHDGMEEFRDYLHKCKDGRQRMDLRYLKAQMDTWGPILMEHLDAEVEALGAENMRRYYTIPEMAKLRI